jgi:hypothetical protein
VLAAIFGIDCLGGLLDPMPWIILLPFLPIFVGFMMFLISYDVTSRMSASITLNSEIYDVCFHQWLP